MASNYFDREQISLGRVADFLGQEDVDVSTILGGKTDRKFPEGDSREILDHLRQGSILEGVDYYERSSGNPGATTYTLKLRYPESEIAIQGTREKSASRLKDFNPGLYG